jgi:hypothetical protein
MIRFRKHYLFRKLARTLIELLRNKPSMKNKLIKFLITVNLHGQFLQMYSRFMKNTNNIGVTWLVSSELNQELYTQKAKNYEKSQTFTHKDYNIYLMEKSKEFAQVSKAEVSVICALYKSDQFLEKFLINLLGQDHFSYTEVCFVICDASDYERDKLKQFVELFQNCKVHFFSDRVGIYVAWNQALSMSSAPLITNMNVDDSRRSDSISRQVKFLKDHSYVDVVYQDLYVTLLPHISWETIMAISPRSKLPSTSFAGLLAGVNAPHNAPMWRRALHLKYGNFDEKYISAGDYEFWLRCASAGTLFLKDRSPHVSYFLNPQGLSTKRSSKAQKEIDQIQKKYLKQRDENTRTDKSLISLTKYDSANEALTIFTLNELQESRVNSHDH